MNYYAEKKEEILRCIDCGKTKEALALIGEELALPYLPVDFFVWLEECRGILYSQEERRRKLPGKEELLVLLRGNYDSQHAAIGYLSELNLRNNMDVCRDYLQNDDGFPDAKILLIKELIVQEVGEEVNANIGDVNYRFVPKELIMPEKSGGYLQADRLIERTFLQDPSLMCLARELLYRRCLEHLPLVFEEEEADYLFREVKQELESLFKN